MPKRPLDLAGLGAMSSDRAIKKTERSHEENQERAYIAASRRADRSIEARVQSARMASEIHKKRTGKGFKISEEIVMKEEMYEEEDDDLPRHYRALAAHLHTSSPDMNSRLSAYLTGQVAMASMARQKEVDKLFAESFPNAAKMGQQMQQSVYYQGLQTQQQHPHQHQPPPPSTFHAALQPPLPTAFVDRRPSSLSTHSSSSAGYLHSPGSSHEHKRPSLDSPPVLSPGSGNSDESSSGSTPRYAAAPSAQLYRHQHYPAYAAVAPQSLSHDFPSPAGAFQSSFTSELPNDAKLLANIDLADPLAAAFYGGGGGDVADGSGFDFAQHQNQHQQFVSVSVDDDDGGGGGDFTKQHQHQQQLDASPYTTHAPLPPPPPQTDYFHVLQQGRFLDMDPGQASRIGTPGGGEGDSWDKWIDENEWSFDSAQGWVKSEQC